MASLKVGDFAGSYEVKSRNVPCTKCGATLTIGGFDIKHIGDDMVVTRVVGDDEIRSILGVSQAEWLLIRCGVCGYSWGWEVLDA